MSCFKTRTSELRSEAPTNLRSDLEVQIHPTSDSEAQINPQGPKACEEGQRAQSNEEESVELINPRDRESLHGDGQGALNSEWLIHLQDRETAYTEDRGTHDSSKYDETPEHPQDDRATPASDSEALMEVQTNTPVAPTSDSVAPDSVVPTNQTPDSAAPTNQTPDSVAPTNQTPDSTNQTPDSVAPTNQTPDSVAPTNQTPDSVAPTNQTSASAAPTNQTPDSVAPTNQKSASAAPTNQTPDSTNQTPDSVAPTNQTPDSVAPTNQTPDSVAPTNQTPDSTNQTPDSVAPTNQTPDSVAPTNQTPDSVAPTNQTSASAAPTNQTPDSTNQTPDSVAPTNQTPDSVAPTNSGSVTVAPISDSTNSTSDIEARTIPEEYEEGFCPINPHGGEKELPNLVGPILNLQDRESTHGEMSHFAWLINRLEGETKFNEDRGMRDSSAYEETAGHPQDREATYKEGEGVLTPQDRETTDYGLLAPHRVTPDWVKNLQATQDQTILAPINPQAPCEDGQADSVSNPTCSDFEAPVSSKERIDILVTGTSGVGKSTLVSALVGKRVVKTENQSLPVKSNNLTGYTVNVTGEEGIEAVVWDSPGLQGSSGKEYQYLTQKYGDIDIIIYCMDITVTRSSGLTAADIEQNDLSAMKKLTTTFGSDWWRRSIFVMTRGNALETALKVKPDPEKRFNEKVKEWREKIVDTLVATGVPKEIACEIPVEPAGHRKKPHLPGRKNWLPALWDTIVQTARNLPHDDQDFVPQDSPKQGEGTFDSVAPTTLQDCESTFEEGQGTTPGSTATADSTSNSASPQVSGVESSATTHEAAGGGATVESGPAGQDSWRAVYFPEFVVHLRVLKIQKETGVPIYPSSDSVPPISPRGRESTCEGHTLSKDVTIAKTTGSGTLADTPAGATVGGFSWRAVTYDDNVVCLKVKPNELPRETQL